jgi:dihydrofolate reductase
MAEPIDTRMKALGERIAAAREELARREDFEDDEIGDVLATINDDFEAVVRGLKAQLSGEIDVAGPELAHGLRDLVDEYRLYIHPVVLGRGKPLFAGPRPPLRLTASDRIGEEVIRLVYVPA